MKKVGIIGAMGSEIEHLRDMLTCREEITIAGRTFFSGKIGKAEVVLVCSGIGKVNSAMSAQILMDHFDLSEVINTGIAGGAHGTKTRDIVISTEVTYHDMDLRILEMSYPNQRIFAASSRLVEEAKKACEGILTYHVGRIVTGDQFISDKTVKADIVNRLDPYAIEMEGGAIAHVCTVNEMPFVIIRSISDNADDSAEMDYDTFEKLAANDAAKIVVAMLKQE
ncbi:MAG: 5'-methylthioadenosine/adenosylhomocysteine nucleosidase [Oscillospiraceae bacterium]